VLFQGSSLPKNHSGVRAPHAVVLTLMREQLLLCISVYAGSVDIMHAVDLHKAAFTRKIHEILHLKSCEA